MHICSTPVQTACKQIVMTPNTHKSACNFDADCLHFGVALLLCLLKTRCKHVCVPQCLLKGLQRASAQARVLAG